MGNDTGSRRRRWGIGTAVLVAAAGGLLFLIFGLRGDSLRPQEEETSIQGPAVVTFIVDGMMKSKSGAT